MTKAFVIIGSWQQNTFAPPRPSFRFCACFGNWARGRFASGLLWVALFLLRSRSANTRYVMSCIGLAILAVLPLITAAVEYPSGIPDAPRLSVTPESFKGWATSFNALPAATSWLAAA